MKLVKGSAEAKRYMASIRAKKQSSIGAEKTKIKKEYNIDYTILLGTITSNNGNLWKVYQKDITKSKGNFITYDWRIVRQKDNLVLTNLPNEIKNKVSLYDFNKNKELLKNLIDIKEMNKLGSVKASKEIKKTLKAKKLYMPHGYETAKRKRKINGVHKDTKSHNVKINVLSGYSGLNKKNSAIDLKRLKQIASSSNNKLTKKVASILIKGAKGYNEGVQTYMAEVIKYGCQSGVVPELIYYNQTTKFYKTYKKEIFAMLKNTLLEYGYIHPHELFGNKWDNEDYNFTHTTNQNLLAWYSFEETTRELANLLGYEL